MEPVSRNPQPDPRTDFRIVEVDATHVHSPPGNRIVTLESLSDLMPSLDSDGQLVPAILYEHPEITGHFMAADGNRRAMAMRVLGRKLKAVILPKAPTESELIRLRIAANFHRKNASAYELAADIQRWMELEGANQRQAAEAHGISASQLSKVLAKAQNACAAVREAEEAKRICPDVARLISTLPKEEMQREALQQAISRDLKRDTVENIVTRMKGAKRPRTAKPVKAKADGVTLVAPGDWTWNHVKELAERLKGAAARGEKLDAPLSLLPSLLKGV